MLREYQTRTIAQLYDWMQKNPGNPCIVMPTGSGKSHVVAALCKDAVQTYEGTRILMLTHVKELIEQNAEKMRLHWPNAPLGIYSSGIGKHQIDAITFGGIQSVRKNPHIFGYVHLIIIDECHLVNHKDEGSYRYVINTLTKINPELRVIGLTATPYRLGHGLITDGTALFDGLIKPVSIEELIYKDFLAALRSKLTKTDYDLSRVHKRGGEYIESELQAAVDKHDKNVKVVQEILRFAGDRKAWLVFCVGVKHAQNVAEILNAHNVPAACITGETPKAEREQLIAKFKSGELRALTNANVLTTGFDYPDIDLIAMLRPTMSPSLYVQMAGRGMRQKSHTDHCLVLDFAGVVRQHGPITGVEPPENKQETDKPSLKICEQCQEICLSSCEVCPACGFEFPKKEPKPRGTPKHTLQLHNDDIMGLTAVEMTITGWQWRVHVGRKSNQEMLAVAYYGGLTDPPITEYFTIKYDGWAGQAALQKLATVATKAKAKFGSFNVETLQQMVNNLQESTPPKLIKYKRKGRFFEVLSREW